MYMTDRKSTTDSNSVMTKKKTSKAKKKTVANKAVPATAKTETTVSEAIAKQTPVETKKHSNSTAIFALIFAMAALVASALSWYQNKVIAVRSESNVAIGITEIGGQMSRIGDSVKRLQEQQAKIVSEDKLTSSLQQVSSTLDEKIERLTQQQSALLKSVDAINNDIKSGANAYAIDEVAQLLKLANNSLVFSADADSALNALTVAATELQGITDPRYNQVKVKLAEEIALLKNLPTIDLQGMSASLNAIIEIVPSLPLENEPETSVVSFVVQESEEATGWRAELAKIWAEIKTAIQIQRVESPPKPLLAPEQRYFLDQNLQLMLGKADLALLQQQDSVFQQNIDATRQWLKDYFDVTDSQVDNVLTQLSEIREQKISVELPSITGSYQLLQTIRGEQ